MKATTHAGRKILEDKEPKFVENRKKSLFIKGRKSSQTLNLIWDELIKFRRDELEKYSRKNDILPFENIEDVQHFCQKQDCSLFLFFSHNKRRPNNLIFGRLYNQSVMEMYEFGVDNYITEGLEKNSFGVGSMPVLIFEGDEWETELAPLRSVFMDFFVGELKGKVNLEQIEHTIVLTYVEETKRIHFRHYLVNKKENCDPELVPAIPTFELTPRRTQFPDPQVIGEALNKPVVDKKKKNITTDGLGQSLGRVFVRKQDVQHRLKLKKFVGLPKPAKRKRDIYFDAPDDAQ